jgi:nucleoid-associated protein YgaU
LRKVVSSSKNTSSEPEDRIHIVVSGDSLWAIALKYLGSGDRYKEIMVLNGLLTSAIRAGQKLRIPQR